MAIPIYMVGTQGGTEDRNPLLSPCIKCLIAHPETGERHICLALLDSGAHPNAISSTLAEQLGLEKIGEDTLHAALAVQSTNIYSGHLVVEGLPGTFGLDFQASNHHANGHPYELILGRRFLTAFDFGYSFERKEWYLSHPSE